MLKYRTNKMSYKIIISRIPLYYDRYEIYNKKIIVLYSEYGHLYVKTSKIQLMECEKIPAVYMPKCEHIVGKVLNTDISKLYPSLNFLAVDYYVEKTAKLPKVRNLDIKQVV